MAPGSCGGQGGPKTSPGQSKTCHLMLATQRTWHNSRAFLGMIQYYAWFLPNLSTELSPLHVLLKKQTPLRWTTECQTAFQRTKQPLTSASALTHYYVERPIRLECDASSMGLGAVRSHEMPDGTHHPMAFASRTLMAAECNYAQMGKEALALIFWVKKFHDHGTVASLHSSLSTSHCWPYWAQRRAYLR